jgi:hypothetical protein
MTKRQPLSDPAKYEFKWVPLDGTSKESAIVRGSGAKAPQELYAALVEQIFEVRGADAVACFLAERLRDPEPHPDVIAMVARWLDPQTDSYIKLVVVRRRRGNPWRARPVHRGPEVFLWKALVAQRWRERDGCHKATTSTKRSGQLSRIAWPR